jgi:hypothetical protein
MRWALLIVTIGWCGSVLMSDVLRWSSEKIPVTHSAWRDEVRRELSVAKPSLLAIASDPKHPGQLLAAEGIGPWWLSCNRTDGSGYIQSNQNDYRHLIMRELLEGESPRSAAVAMEADGVDCIVATPSTLGALHRLSNTGYLTPYPDSEWLFRFR